MVVGAILDLHALDPRFFRSASAPLDERGDLLRRSRRQCLDVTARQIADPTRETESKRFVAGRGAIRHALHEALDAKVDGPK